MDRVGSFVIKKKLAQNIKRPSTVDESNDEKSEPYSTPCSTPPAERKQKNELALAKL